MYLDDGQIANGVDQANRYDCLRVYVYHHAMTTRRIAGMSIWVTSSVTLEPSKIINATQ